MTIVIAELTSYLLIAALNELGGEEIRTTGLIYRAQTERLDQLLASDETLLVTDPELGWIYRPGYRSDVVGINGLGLRADREYTPAPGACVVRVAAFGDSFVYGSEVDNPSAWPTLLEAAHPTIEALNYGVGGYGLDQALLRFRAEGDRLAPSIVVIGVTPEMLRRNVNVYRRFVSTSEFPIAKPRFRLAGGELRLIENPLRGLGDYRRLRATPELARELGRHDALYEPAIYENPAYDVSATVRLLTYLGVKAYDRHLASDRLLRGDQFNPDSEAFALLVALVSRFVDEVRARGLEPLVVLFPDAASVRRARDGDDTIYAPLLPAISVFDAAIVDVVDAFAAAPPAVERWFMPGGHYSRPANRLVAAFLAGELGRIAVPAGLIGESCPTPFAASSADGSVQTDPRF